MKNPPWFFFIPNVDIIFNHFPLYTLPLLIIRYALVQALSKMGDILKLFLLIKIKGIVSPASYLHNSPANGKQGPIPEELSQTLLTNEKQGNQD
jgi:hypothetical protein